MKIITIKKFTGLFFISILVSVFCFTNTSYAEEKVNNKSILHSVNEISYRLDLDNHDAIVDACMPQYAGDVHILGNVTYNGEEYKVKSIKTDAFFGCPFVDSVIFPDTLIKIEKEAFYECGIKSAIFPPNSQLNNIPVGAFTKCSSLTTVILPDKLEIVFDYAFSECNSLKTITIPNNVQHISDHSFGGCSALESITFRGEKVWIEDDAFAGCSNLKDMYFYGNHGYIYVNAFKDMKFNLHCPLKGTNWDTSEIHLGNADHINYINLTAFELTGQCYDCGLKLPIKNHEIQILDVNDNVITSIHSDENGDYNFKLFKDRQYTAKTIKVRTTYQGKTFTSKEISTDSNKHLNIVFN
ncbi:MAG: leucine-rich repeat domain-containing protein [Coriobacteriia bacterium]|nr:leucine-rich repeat domain-containing protein [Coriobacteriia bacterium]